MNILVFNCGSSSLKYRLIRMPDETELAGGEAQHVGPPTVEPACIVHHVNGTVQTRSVDMPDHATAFQRVMELLAEDAHSTPDAVGHRLVHGGSHFNQYAIINTRTIEQLQSLESLAPLHNPPAIALIRA